MAAEDRIVAEPPGCESHNRLFVAKGRVGSLSTKTPEAAEHRALIADRILGILWLHSSHS